MFGGFGSICWPEPIEPHLTLVEGRVMDEDMGGCLPETPECEWSNVDIENEVECR